VPIISGSGGATLGSVVRLYFYTYDTASAPANATAVTCVITRPDGTTTSGSVTNTATGVYEVQYTPTQVGHHGVYWQATGLNASAAEDTFSVDDHTVAPAVSLSEVRAHLNMVGDDLARDGELTAFINAAQSAIEARVGPLTRRPVTEVHNGGVSGIVLRQSPVIAVDTVTENGTSVTGFTLSPGGGVLTRTSGYSRATWADGYGNVSVTYTAGRTSIPADLRQAVLELIRHLWKTQRGQQGRAREEEFIAGQGYSMPNRVLELIAPYEIPGIA
jgi:uncharacterized phiE125 gp8 family phage protein